MNAAALSAAPASARKLGPLDVRVDSAESAIALIVRAMAERQRLCVAFANTHLLYYALKERAVADRLGAFYLLNDGIGLTLLAKMICGEGFRENLNGTDFTPRLLAAAAPGTRVFLLGAKPDVIEAAAVHFQLAFPHLILCGHLDGYSANGKDAQLCRLLTDAEPDLVLVAMGNPLQEQCMGRCAARMPACVFLGVGALFDFFAGDKPRAPDWMQTARLEWLYRLSVEPSRLWRRYTLEVAYVTLMLLRRRMAPNQAAQA